MLGEGADKADLRGHYFDGTIDFGGGDDVLLGGSGLTPNALGIVMGAGNDTVTAHRQPYRFARVSGGTGTDLIDFLNSTFCPQLHSGRPGLRVSLDGVVNDGCDGHLDQKGNDKPGPGNILPDFETLRGTLFADRIQGSAFGERIEGLDGNDSIRGDGGNDVIVAGGGNDVINAGPGSDTVDAGSGGDLIDGDTGADDIRGGPDRDRVTYSSRTAGVVVHLDDVANDGGENDNIHSDVEDLTGTQSGDSLNGSALANVLDGLGGNDILRGFDGNDTLLGGAGSGDVLDGGNHTDRCDVGTDGGSTTRCES